MNNDNDDLLLPHSSVPEHHLYICELFLWNPRFVCWDDVVILHPKWLVVYQRILIIRFISMFVVLINLSVRGILSWISMKNGFKNSLTYWLFLDGLVQPMCKTEWRKWCKWKILINFTTKLSENPIQLLGHGLT